ncbi:hypothetical protein [Planococcus sp. 107-1]|uniref:hypothetical protein n=1 Tax=Planococcus sp. 107-1 TaxID=2908840 RepID=UPI001F323229|nr:hypothetical protein [Planococcus sp. 107-1]UJF28445.1 hypothetical protein L0M13_09125 [Planococcus sp. 107-1]
MKNILSKAIYCIIAFGLFLLFLNIYGWIENAYLPFTVQTQLISLIVVLPVLAVVSFVLSSVIVNRWKA